MKLIVTKFKDDSVIKVNQDKPEYGSICVKSDTFSNTNGFLNRESRTGFVAGKVKDLEALGIKEGMDLSVVLGAMKIVYLESTVKEDEGYRELVNPQSNEIVTTPEGEVVYRKVLVVAENSDICDKKLSHLSVKAAAAKQEQDAMKLANA